MTNVILMVLIAGDAFVALTAVGGGIALATGLEASCSGIVVRVVH